jgi:sugar lactone lactonase YvrE
MIPTTIATLLYSPINLRDRFLPEGPREIRFDGSPALAWVNIQTATDACSGMINLRFWETDDILQFPMPKRPGFILPTDRDNVLLVGMEKEVGTFDLKTKEWKPLATIPDINERTIINDGEIVPGGRAVVFGTKDLKFADPIANLYLFTLDDQKIHLLDEEHTCSNGKVMYADGDEVILYDIDTPRRAVHRYRLNVASRTLRDMVKVIDLGDVDGFPDGMIGAPGDSLIIAMYNPDTIPQGKAHRFHIPTGKILEEWDTPLAPRVTCPLLTERNGEVQLVLTTADEGMPDNQRPISPESGSLFIAKTSFKEIAMAEVILL